MKINYIVLYFKWGFYVPQVLESEIEEKLQQYYSSGPLQDPRTQI